MPVTMLEARREAATSVRRLLGDYWPRSNEIPSEAVQSVGSDDAGKEVMDKRRYLSVKPLWKTLCKSMRFSSHGSSTKSPLRVRAGGMLKSVRERMASGRE